MENEAAIFQWVEIGERPGPGSDGAMQLVGDWTSQQHLEASRAQYQRLFTPRKKPRLRPPPPLRRADSPRPTRPALLTEPRFKASRHTVLARKKKPTDASDSSLTSEDSDPDYLGDSDDEDDEGGAPGAAGSSHHESLVPIEVWFREVEDGLDLPHGRGLETYHDVSHYLDVMRSQMTHWVASLLSSTQPAAVTSVCVDLWIRIHSVPSWGWRSGGVAYSLPYHVMCVLSEMRCPGGLRIPIAELRHYNTRWRYEAEPICWVVAVAHDKDVEMAMPAKKELARVFSSIRAVDSREGRAPAASGDTRRQPPNRKNAFKWVRHRATLGSCLCTATHTLSLLRTIAASASVRVYSGPASTTTIASCITSLCNS